MTDHYVYDTLSRDGLCTRLLRLAPGGFDDPVRFTLQSVRLKGKNNATSYEAISYACGDTSNKEAVHCFDKLLYVNRNLFTALRYFRSPDSSRCLWADAICIDEKDVEERNYQVSNMPLIYRHAARVLVWLGEEDDHSSQALLMLREISVSRPDFDIQKFKPDVLMSELEHDDSFAARTAEPFLASRTRRFKALSAFATTYVGLLIQRPWFQRAWVVQEVAYAKQVDVICGRMLLPLDIFIRGLSLVRIGGVSEMNYQYWLSLGNAYFFRSYETPSPRILEVLQCFRSRQASDPRDKVIAIAALCSLPSLIDAPTSGLMLPCSTIQDGLIDYKLSPQELYIRVAKQFLGGDTVTDLDLDYLSMPQQHTLKGLPSWVVDWSTANSTIISFPTRMSRTKHIACGQSKPFAKVNGHKLTLNGFMFDEVTTMAPAFPDAVSDWDVQQCFPASSSLISIIPRIWFLAFWWATKTAIEIRIANQWDHVAGPYTPEQYCQTLNACDFGHGNEQAMFDSFQDWRGSRRLSTLAFRLGLAYTSILVYIIALIDHGLRSAHKQLSGRTLPRYLFTTGRSLGRTKGGRLILLPGTAQPGDKIGLFKGVVRPIVARLADDPYAWTFIGDCYSPGVMAGEAFDESMCGDVVFV